MAEHLPEHTQDTTDEDSLTEPPEYDENGQANGFVDDIHIATVEEKKRRWWRNALINSLFIGSWYAANLSYHFKLTSYVMFYRFVFAMVLSLYNKWMFSPEHFGFPFPLFVTTMHMCVQFVIATALRTIWPHYFRPKHSPGREDYV